MYLYIWLGTTSLHHLQENLSARKIVLSPTEIQVIYFLLLSIFFILMPFWLVYTETNGINVLTPSFVVYISKHHHHHHHRKLMLYSSLQKWLVIDMPIWRWLSMEIKLKKLKYMRVRNTTMFFLFLFWNFIFISLFYHKWSIRVFSKKN
jgi:hypothetical protein